MTMALAAYESAISTSCAWNSRTEIFITSRSCTRCVTPGSKRPRPTPPTMSREVTDGVGIDRAAG